MRVIEGKDVNEMYWRGMNMLYSEGFETDSRNGKVLRMPGPVTSVYEYPRRRVLLDQTRQANPFFHLAESLWMLAGRDDVAFLNKYITDFGTRYAETTGVVHGAYGHRWRRAFGYDQLETIVGRLNKDPNDRQCVLQMWDGDVHGSNDLNGSWRDRPCNTHVYFNVRREATAPGVPGPSECFTTTDGKWWYLDMLVSCRSNDIVFGAYGANAVHFSVLHEYVAGRVGLLQGKMYQMSWNYHAYVDVLQKIGNLGPLETYEGRGLESIPMADRWDEFDRDLGKFMGWLDELHLTGKESIPNDYVNGWFTYTASPMFLAHHRWKHAMKDSAIKTAARIEASDWRYAALQWFNQRSDARSR